MPSRLRALLALAFLTAALPAVANAQTPAPPQEAATAQGPDCFRPHRVQDGLAAGDPAMLGFDARALCALLREIDGSGVNLHSLLVLRHGRLVAELYRTGLDAGIYSLWRSSTAFGPDALHDMRSVSKSVLGLTYGILMAKGPAVATPAATLFPEYAELATPERRAIQIEHLLTMSSGLDWDEPSPIHRPSRDDQFPLAWKSSAYPFVFGRDMVASPGSRFVYSGGSTSVLAEIMTRSAGDDLRSIVRKELFEPLGIADWEWSANLRGAPIAFGGLRLKPRDLMKIGATMLAGGVWQGRQIVPKSWIARSTRALIDTGDGGYGYQWWTSAFARNGKRLAAATALGNGGQTLTLIPDLDLAVVTTAGEYNSPAIFPVMRNIVQKIVNTARP